MKNKTVLFIIVILIGIGIAAIGFSQPEQSARSEDVCLTGYVQKNPDATTSNQEAIGAGKMGGKYQKFWIKFRGKNQSECADIDEQKITQLRRRLKYLRQIDPKRYQQAWKRLRCLEFAYCRKLQQENPEKARCLMAQKKLQFKMKLWCLKKTNPGKYAQVKRQIQGAKFERLCRLRQENPEQFKQLLQERKIKLNMALEKLKYTNPVKYNRIKNNIEVLRHYEQLKKIDAKRAELFLEHHPWAKDLIRRCRSQMRGSEI